MATRESKPAALKVVSGKAPRALKIFALDPETSQREELGAWMVDDRWQILEINGIGHYQEMLEEIAEECNELDELEHANASMTTQSEPDWVDRGSPEFGAALAVFLKDQFDLEFV